MSLGFYLTPIQLLARNDDNSGWRVATAADIADDSKRKTTGYRAMIYGQFAFSGVIGNLGVKQWGLVGVDTDSTVHAAIANDNAIIVLPTGVLDTLFGDLNTTVQNAIISALSNRNVPTDWITATTTVRQIVGYILKILDLTNKPGMGTNYPEGALSARWDTLTTQQRTAILTWMAANGIQTNNIQVNTALRVVIRRIIEQYNWTPFVVMGETF